jgi:hypothetical protein
MLCQQRIIDPNQGETGAFRGTGLAGSATDGVKMIFLRSGRPHLPSMFTAA